MEIGHWRVSIFSGCKGYQPSFTEPIGNITVPVGREALFTCQVHSLGGYRVSFVRNAFKPK